MSDWVQWYFLWPVLLGGAGVSLIAGPLGAVMVWQRLAYFSDTLAHSGLLGVTLALLLQLNVVVGIMAIALSVAFLLLVIQRRLAVSSDTLLSLLSHTMLAMGLLALARLETIRVDVLGFLYGDILTMTWREVGVIYSGGSLVLLVLAKLWQSLLRLTLDRELAQVEGVPTQSVQAIYVVLLAATIAIAIKIVGVLLMTSLLVIPATTARIWAKTPEQMALMASFIGVIAVWSGIGLSYHWDLPTGPLIVVISAAFLLIGGVFKKRS